MADNITINHSALQKMLERANTGYSNNQKEWLSLGVGMHRMRIAPPYDDKGMPVHEICTHERFMLEGRTIAPVCYNFLFSKDNAHLAERALKEGAINKADLTYFKETGCPLCKIRQELYQQKEPEKAKGFGPKTKYIWNVVLRSTGKMYKWSTSKEKFDSIITYATQYPDVFSATTGRDFLITATGDGLSRRYSQPIFVEPSPLDCEDTPFDLDEAVILGVRHAEVMTQVGAAKLQHKGE